MSAADYAAMRTLLSLDLLVLQAANILAQRNSTNAQSFRVNNTHTDASNGEWVSIGFQETSNVAVIRTNANGTGTVRPIRLSTTPSTSYFEVNASAITMRSATTCAFKLESNSSGTPYAATIETLTIYGGINIKTPGSVGENSNIVLSPGNVEKFRIMASGNVGIGVVTPLAKLDVNGDSIRISQSQTPATAAATGVQGEIAWDASYIYVCTATDTWKRATIATW